jgi:YidC/Oxa1 family membrane protein insertase
MTDQKNTLLAIVLSAIVLIGWQYFVGLPQMQKQKEQAQQQQTTQPPSTTPQAQPNTTPQSGAPTTTQPTATPPGPQAPAASQVITREAAIALSPRVQIETPRLKGSIALKGGRVDDLELTQYRTTVNPASPAIVLLAPSGARKARARSASTSPSRSSGTMARACNSAASSRSTTSTCSPSTRRSPTRAPRRSRFILTR